MSTLALFEDLHNAIAPIWLGKFYAVTLPKVPSYPCGVYTVLGSEPNVTLCGPSDLTKFRVRVDCFALDYREVIANRDSVVEQMMKFKHPNEPAGEYEVYESAVAVYRRLIDYYVWYKELAAGPAVARSAVVNRK